MKCPICGYELDADAKFCAKCGKKVPRCPTCGTILYERSRFCANDGTPLPEALFADFPPAGGVVTGPVSPPPGSRKRSDPQSRSVPDPKPPKKKKRGAATAVLVVVLLLVFGAAVAAGTYYVMQNGLPSFGGGASSGEERDDRDSRRDSDEDGGDESQQSGDVVQDALDQAEEYAGDGDYSEALAVIREALEEEPKSRKLKNALEDYEGQYASALLSQVDQLIGEGRLEDAREVLSQGLAQLPEHTELQDRIDRIDGLIAQETAVPPVTMSGVASVTASSYLSEPGLNLYHTPERVTDGSLSTAWVEGLDGAGVGESITFTFDRTYRFSGMRINAGYQKSDELYQMNDRPASLTLTFSDGTQQTVALQDVNARQDITFSFPVEAESVRVSIASVYTGTTYADTVISELSFY